MLETGKIFHKGVEYSGTGETYSAGTSIEITDQNVINHSNSGVIKASPIHGSVGNLDFGDSIDIPTIAYNRQGHITDWGVTKVILPNKPSDTTYSAGTGIEITDQNVINHSNNISKASPAQGTPTPSTPLDFGSSFNIPTISYDGQGHITDWTVETLTLPSAPAVTTYSASAGIKITNENVIEHSSVIGSGTATGTSTSTLTPGGSFTVPAISYDNYGHITSWEVNTLTLPSGGGGGVGQSTEGVEYHIGQETYIGQEGAEIFNSYTTQVNEAIGKASHAEGENNTALGNYSHAEGRGNLANGVYSHVEGYSNKANEGAHAEGEHTQALGVYSHTEGNSTQTNAQYAHAEGHTTQANGSSAHAEGSHTEAAAQCSHAEGDSTIAYSNNAHAEGYYTQANGMNSHAAGEYTIANGENQTVIGKYNIPTPSRDNSCALIIGNGTSALDEDRSNLFKLDWNSTMTFSYNGNSVTFTFSDLQKLRQILDNTQ